MSSLTKEQLERIEANRQLALQRRNERLKLQNKTLPSSSGSNNGTDYSRLKQSDNARSVENVPANKLLSASGHRNNDNLFPSRTFYSDSVTDSSGTKSNACKAKSADHGLLEKQYNSNSSQYSRRSVDLFPKSDIQKFMNNSKVTGKHKPFGEQVVTGNCRLLSKERFTIVVPYQAQLIDIFKSIPSKAYDPKEKTWNFAISDYNLVLKKVQDLKGAVSISELPSYVLQPFLQQAHASKSYKDVDLSRIDKTLLDSLMPFQRDGVCFGISKRGRCLLADDMGLGKTIQALGISHYYENDWPLLIVCPSSVRYLWMDSILTWLPSVPYHTVKVMTTSKEYISDANILITSYDLLSRCVKELEQINFGTFIMDESHFLKSSKSARTKAATTLLKNAKRIIMLSGTPALSRPIELYPQISAINSRLFPSFFEFGIRYCNGTKNNFGWDFSGSSNMEELQLLLESQLMIRRLKSKVISQLPPKVRQMIILNPELVYDKTKEMKQCVKNLDQKHLTAMEKRGALLTYYCATGKAKLKAVQDYISDMLDSDKKFICFAHHQMVLDGISETISGKKREYIRIDGSTSSNNRKILCDKFQYEEKYAAAVLSITAANAGITLTAAHLVIFAELYWNPGILTQAEDRAHRIGQEDSVLVQYLVAKGTADDHLWPMIQNKLNVLNKAGLSKDNFMETEVTYVQKSKMQPSILNYFSELSAMEDDVTNEELLDVDIDGILIKEKKLKLSDRTD